MKLADFGLSQTVERSGNDLPLFHARWAAPERWDDYIDDDDDYIEGDMIGNDNLIKCITPSRVQPGSISLSIQPVIEHYYKKSAYNKIWCSYSNTLGKLLWLSQLIREQ